MTQGSLQDAVAAVVGPNWTGTMVVSVVNGAVVLQEIRHGVVGPDAKAAEKLAKRTL